MTRIVALLVLPFAVTVAALWPVRRIALGFRIMDVPGPRKAHREPVPYLGGVAILLGAGVSILILQPSLWPVLVMLLFLACLGFVDDVRSLPVWTKLVGEVVVAVTAIGLGYSWHVSDSFVLNAAFSILWIVGLTNSYNLLDNMDGLASTAAASSLIITAALVQPTMGLALPLAGACVGFLVINRPPARMYMGDTGSLMLGFGVAVGSIWAANSTHGLHSFVILAFPVAVALFDTSLVVVSRLLTGRPIQLGGQDHFSHRLRLIGLSPLVILGVTIWGSMIAWACAALALLYPLAEAWLAVPIALAFVAAWALLLKVDPYAVANQPRIEVYRDQTGA
ncbi:MAG TPA: MraY family glycosyltransferase [Candidatus Dormibacteraeota bacterium]|nr:MraY family glycosyltransferase [Candidatus Dormibacteraeota bacterium]